MHPDPARLAAIPILEDLSEADLDRIASWLEVEEFLAGKRLTREGSADYAFFILEEGTASVERDGRHLADLGPGDVFGELSFFDKGRRVADVVATTDVRVLSMFGAQFRELQMGMPTVAKRLEYLATSRTEFNETALS